MESIFKIHPLFETEGLGLRATEHQPQIPTQSVNSAGNGGAQYLNEQTTFHVGPNETSGVSELSQNNGLQDPQ